jgi:CRP/FNR family transcriptional regulator
MKTATRPPETEASPAADSFLGGLPASIRAALLEGATTETVRPRHRIAGPDGHLTGPGVLLSGAARAYLLAAGGRQLTVGYVGPGGLVGRLPSEATNPTALSFQAITACTVSWILPASIARAADTHGWFSSALMAETNRRLADAYMTLAMRTFGSVQERIARHLTDLTRRIGSGDHVAPMTQQQLADSVGTAREVVARVLRDFRAAGLVETRHREIAVIDPAGLAALVGRWRRSPWPAQVGPPRGAETFFDASPMAIVAVDPFGIITYANPSVERTFGWEPVEVIGGPVDRLFAGRDRRRPGEEVAGYLAALEERVIGGRSALAARHRDGRALAVHISLAPIETPSGPLVFVTFVADEPGSGQP